MKLRLPLFLVAALSLSWTAVKADDNASSDISDIGNITSDTNFTAEYVGLSGDKTVTIGTAGGGSSPVVNFNILEVQGQGSTLEILSGKVVLKKEGMASWGCAHSLLLNGILNMRGGELSGETLHIGRDATAAVMNLYGGKIRFKGILNYQNPGNITFGTINLMGGTLELGGQGFWIYNGTSEKNPIQIALNLYKGTLGAYESWSTENKQWNYNNDTGEWSETKNYHQNDIVWQLDYAGALLPDGSTSDGKGSVKIAPAAGTTITVGSLIKGTGTGDFIKTGAGTLFINSTGNTFTQNVVLAGGSLIVKQDGALGASTKTITVINDGSAESSSYDMIDTAWALRFTNYSFLVQDGAKLVFPKGNDVMFGFAGHMTFEHGSITTFEDEVFIGLEAIVQSGANVVMQDSVYMGRSTQVELSGTMTVEKKEKSDGLLIGGYHGAWWQTSQFVINDGGFLDMPGARASLGKGVETGQLIINEGGKAVVWGIEDKGIVGKVVVAGGTLELGAGGILFHDQLSNWDNGGRNGDEYLSDVYFSSGKMVINEDSAYRYEGVKVFPEKDGHPAGAYTGHFFFGKDNTGALDDVDSKRIIEVGAGATFSLTEAVLGDGGFNKTGAGTVVLSAANGYKGDTVVEEGTLHLGDDAALGTTGKLTLLSGTTLAALGQNVSAVNNMDLGKTTDTEYSVTFGREGQTDSLAFAGDMSLLAGGTAEFNVLSDIAFNGNVVSNADTLTKKGNGVLTISRFLSGVRQMDIEGGGVALGADDSFSAVRTFNMGAGTSLDLGGAAGTADRVVNLAGSAKLKGMTSYAGRLNIAAEGTADNASNPWTVAAEGKLKAKDVHFNSQNARLSTDGTFTAESVTFQLGLYNATFGDRVQTLITATDAAVTGTEKGSITLDFDLSYIREHMSTGGSFKLFSTGLDYQEGSIQYTQRQEISLDTSRLAAEGYVLWSQIKWQGYLLPADYMNGKYIPSNNKEYLGAEYNGGTPIKVGAGVVYEFDDSDILSYKLTPGKGTLVYQGVLDQTDKGLDVIDYAGITQKEEDRSLGSVILTNNGNSYGGGTNVSGTTLVVDLSQGENPGLENLVSGGNLNVSALGTGEVTVTAGIMGYGGSLRLQSYGNETLGGAKTFTYGNSFRLNGGSSLVQAGGNDQIITGDIILESGMNTVRNESGKTLTLKGNITQTTGDGLVLENTEQTGRITLSGEEKALTATLLQVNGTGTVDMTSGYAAHVREVQVSGGVLTIGPKAELTIGQGGLSGNGTFVLNGGTIKSSSSWESSVALTLGTGENTLNTGGANVRLNRGVTGEGGFIKQGTGHLYVYDNAAGNAKGLMEVRQGRLVLLGAAQDKTRAAGEVSSEYTLNGDLALTSGKGASLQGKINANGHNVTFGDNTHFYLEVAGESETSGYIRDAGTLTIGTGTQLHVDVLDDTWTTENTYTIFSAREDIQGANNLELALNEEYAFVDVSLNLDNSKEIGLNLTQKGSLPTKGLNDGTNKGAIHAVVAPLVDGVLDNSTELTGKMKQHMQKVSKMTTTEYQTYLTGMGNSASSFYTALSAQVQDATQHINSVRNRVELINPVMYDDWTQGGIYNVWAGGINHYRDVKSNSEAPGYEMTSWGGELGCAIPLSQTFMIGVGFAYTFTDVQVKDGWGNNDNDTYSVDLFARYRKDALTITGVLTGGFTNTEFHRNQILKDETFRANSSTDGNQFMGTLEAGYDFYLNEEKSWILQPLVNLTAGRAKLDSLSETGDLKNAGLMIGSQSYNMFSAGIGAKIAYQYKNDVSDLPGRVELKAMYVNDMGDVDYKVNGRFIGAPENGFDLRGVSNEKSAVIVSAGWIAPISAYGQFFVDAGCEFRKDQNGVNTTIGFSFQF